jgi:site-specific recombinase XerC
MRRTIQSIYEQVCFTWTKNRHFGQLLRKPVASLPFQVVNDKGGGFNRSVVVRYRSFLERLSLSAATINLYLSAIRRLADESAESGWLSPEMAIGIRRVKGGKLLGRRIGNWLTADQAQRLVNVASHGTLLGRRDGAMLGLLLGCGLRRSEVVGLQLDQLQLREGHWVIVDLVGKGGRIRTVPVPA